MRIRRRVLRIVLLSVVLLVILGGVWLKLRIGKAYPHPLPQLVPPDVPVYVAIDDFGTFLDELLASPALQRALDSGLLHQVLVESKQWRKIAGDASQWEKTVPLRLTLHFAKRWFGQQVVFTVIEQGKELTPLLITRVRFGFEESLGEFVWQNFPGFELQKQKYRRVTLYQYERKKQERRFAYFRLGDTVLFAFGARSVTVLQQIIDQHRASAPSVMQSPEFENLQSWGSPQPGMGGFARTAPLLSRVSRAEVAQLPERLSSHLWVRMRQEQQSLVLDALSAPEPVQVSPEPIPSSSEHVIELLLQPAHIQLTKGFWSGEELVSGLREVLSVPHYLVVRQVEPSLPLPIISASWCLFLSAANGDGAVEEVRALLNQYGMTEGAKEFYTIIGKVEVSEDSDSVQLNLNQEGAKGICDELPASYSFLWLAVGQLAEYTRSYLSFPGLLPRERAERYAARLGLLECFPFLSLILSDVGDNLHLQLRVALQ